MLSKYGNCTRVLKNLKKTENRLFLQIKNSRYFEGVFNKTIIPLALVGYEMIIANSSLRASLASTISYPTCTRGIIVKNNIYFVF